jgi:DNA-binding IclR family transcriptional regulator
MLARGWLVTDPTGTIYSLGIRTLLLGSNYLEGDRVVAATEAILDELAASTGETVHLGRLEGSDVVYLAKRESIHPLRMFSAVGRRLPAYATALGRAILAERSDEDIKRLLPRTITAITPYTVTSRRDLIRAIQLVRDTEYASEVQESCPGVSCFAVSLPLATPAKEAISVSVPLTRLDDRVRSHVVSELARARAAFEPLAGSSVVNKHAH